MKKWTALLLAAAMLLSLAACGSNSAPAQNTAATTDPATQATPVSLEVTENGFHMEVDYVGGVDFFDPANPMASTQKVAPVGIVDVYAAKADGLANLSDINPEVYQYWMDCSFPNENGVELDFVPQAIYLSGTNTSITTWMRRVTPAI